jgi:nucleoside-diphosphate-sugar epimerase
MKVRIARFQNCFDPEGTWTGGREKAPAAICRKVAEAGDGGTIEVWGDGTAIRSHTYIGDMVDGIHSVDRGTGPIRAAKDGGNGVRELSVEVEEKSYEDNRPKTPG